MKKLTVLVLLILASASASALSPSIEVDCCGYLGHWEDYYGGSLVQECPQYNLTEETCKPILESWERTTEWYAGEIDEYARAKDMERLFGAAGVILFAFIIYWVLTRKKKPAKKRR